MSQFSSAVRTLLENRPYGAKLKSQLPKQPPAYLYHVTLSAPAILSKGFLPRAKTGHSVLGGGSDDSVSFTEDFKFAKVYAAGLKVCIEASQDDFDPWKIENWVRLVSRYGFPGPQIKRAYNIHHLTAVQRGWSSLDFSFDVLQMFSMLTKTFPLIMGGSWPRAILNASVDDVRILRVSSEGPQLWSYHPGEKEYRVYDPEHLKGVKVVQ